MVSSRAEKPSNAAGMGHVREGFNSDENGEYVRLDVSHSLLWVGLRKQQDREIS